MVRTASTMLPLGTTAPDFTLDDCHGKSVSRDQARGPKGLLVIFMCNHCPYVKHVAPELPRLAEFATSQGVGVVGISSNDVEKYPDDSPEQMRAEAAQQGYEFPYLYDESQQVAIDYHAACTPDFFLFDDQLQLVYRGQLDDSRPKNGSTPDGSSLRAAIEAMVNGQAQPEPQRPSIGCNIKWKPGLEPTYFDPAGTA